MHQIHARLLNSQAPDYLVIHGDTTEEFVLEQAGIRRASVLATVLSADATTDFVTIIKFQMTKKVFASPGRFISRAGSLTRFMSAAATRPNH